MDLRAAVAASLESGPHALLGDLVGRWEGRARLWLDPGVLLWEDVVRGTIEPIHDGRWIVHTYTTRIEDAEESGTALIGCVLRRKTWQVAWVDTWHTGTEVQVSEGAYDERAREISVLATYGEEGWQWRTVFAPDGGALLIRHYNISPAGDEALAVEFAYERA